MSQQSESKEEFKKILSSQWVMAFFLMMGSFLYDILLYAHNGSFVNTWVYSLILVLYFCAWLFCLWLGKGVAFFVLIINFLLFLVFKEYYKMHIIPLKLYTVVDLYQEGIVAGFKNKTSLIDSFFWIAFVVLLLQLVVVLRHSFGNLKKAFWLLCGGIFFGFYFFTSLFLGVEAVVQVIYPSLFLSYQQGMLYKAKWIAEIFTDKTATQIDQLISKGNSELRLQMRQDELFLSPLPRHIYLIQAESLTTKALQAQKNNQKIMPFLQEKRQEATSFFKIDKNHYHCLGSANTDFMMMSGMPLECEETHTLVFYSYPPQIYKKIKTLAFVLKEKGYETTFLHGYQGAFFNRYKHYKAMGFDKILFESDFSVQTPRWEWGIDDNSLLNKAAELTSLNNKTFMFIITAGMHPPYESPSNVVLPLLNPQNELENYLNSSYVLDRGLKALYQQAPEDSFFIVYGDHNVPDIQAFDTPVFMFYKGEKAPLFPATKKDGFQNTVYDINSLFEGKE